MRIAFIHKGTAPLPELEAYRHFFENRGHQTLSITNNKKPNFEADVEWHFMGSGGQRMFQGTKLIHEYASASVAPMASLKNNLKRWLNIKPDFRIYLNERVQKVFRFNDSVPFGYRDMGININFINDLTCKEKLYDFIFPGSVEPYSFFKKLLLKFSTKEFADCKLLVISNIPENNREEWAAFKNIEFRPLTSNEKVLELISQSKFGINFRPPVDPYTFQTATKILEYAACRVPVITTPSIWLSEFQQRHGGKFFILSPGLENLTLSNLGRFQFEFPDVKDFEWEKQIIRSGICDFLNIAVN